ncbi:unnamed protein product [Kuraishia capsulata CBS 1993]|uniref:Uncharacterized protein n=1 Tax=Kuraishia capsulata CBS 1993 TaxID=1382522 RepID=W6MXE6_9ASCO|nr:uncharacterized protein KUCA_T00004740001 [Kuraishia capsulata CBS 1993]CDK28755.1 unnamed protein product [Kuraishia capsulata CBS 1993]
MLPLAVLAAAFLGSASALWDDALFATVERTNGALNCTSLIENYLSVIINQRVPNNEDFFEAFVCVDEEGYYCSYVSFELTPYERLTPEEFYAQVMADREEVQS